MPQYFSDVEDDVPKPRSDAYPEGQSLARTIVLYGFAGLAGVGLAIAFFAAIVAYDLPVPLLR